MPAVRIISWNIFNFAAGKNGVLSRADSTERMLEVVHPATGAAACDIFVIIEPVTKKAKVGAIATGGGPTGGTQILGMLQSRTTGGADWAVADTLCIYSKTKGETVLVFYRTPVVTINAGPVLLSNVAAVMPNWRILNVRESCPFHITFSLTGSGTTFELIAQHAPSPSYGHANNRKANVGVQQVGVHASVTGSTRVVYLGDLNLCGVPDPTLAPACDLTGHDDDRTTLNNLGMTLVAGEDRSSLKKSAAQYTTYREHAYDNILAKGHTAVANAAVIDLIAPLITTYQLTKPGAIAANVFASKSVFYKVRIGKNRGISDHLPIKVTVTF